MSESYSTHNSAIIARLMTFGKAETYGKLISMRKCGQIGKYLVIALSSKSKNRLYALVDSDYKEKIKELKNKPRSFDSYGFGTYTLWKCDDTFIHGFIDLAPVGKGWVGYTVNYSFIDPKLRGKGIGKKFYTVAIFNKNNIIVSGSQQTKHSRLLWLSFLKDKKYNVWAHDMNNLDETLDIYLNENGKLPNDLEKMIYGGYTSSGDWRMVVTKGKI